MRKLIASIAIASIGITAGATASSAATHARHCGHGIDPTVVLRNGQWVAAWGWQYTGASVAHLPVGVWTNSHGRVVGYAAYEDTPIMRTAACAMLDR